MPEGAAIRPLNAVRESEDQARPEKFTLNTGCYDHK
jgi:hypothetical protein